MRGFFKIVLPVVGMAIGFTLIYALTLPQVELPDSPEVKSAALTLHDYGYEITGSFDYGHLCICFSLFVISVILYFYYYDKHEKKQILKVVAYARKINQRVYDLKLEENSEEELSLLSNELYKTTVLLSEAAETNRQYARELETALMDISHQLRTPLTSLSIMLDNLYDNPDLDEETRQEFLSIAVRQTRQMSDLVVTLLNLAKLDNGTLKMRSREVKVGEMVDKVIENLSILAEISEVEVVASGDLGAKLKVDPRWQVEALTNIMKNCIEHSGRGQTVEIRVETSVIFTRVTICDQGEGIAPEDVRHIFERFYRAKNAKDESVGIGLAFSKKLIEAEGGQVRVRSRLGVGTRYTITYFR